VNWQHFQAFLWLRWRLLANQMRRGGAANTVLAVLLVVGIVLIAAVLSLVLFLVGLFGLDDVPPAILMYVWDGLVVAFLFSWTLGLMIELQRSEVLSLDKFLHLPVSLKSAFLINYVSSLLSPSLLIFGSAMFAFSLGLVIGRGPALLLLLPVLAAFLLMVTAVTYQFQGWLASLMSNPRRRRTVIVVVTATFILLCQLPNLVNILQPWQPPEELKARHEAEVAELKRALNAGEINEDQFKQQSVKLEQKYEKQTNEAMEKTVTRLAGTTRIINLALPPGWLPLSAEAAAERHFVTPLLGTLGLSAIGSLSLWRAYRTTLRLYTGQFTAGKKAAVPIAPVKLEPGKVTQPSPLVLEKQLPWLSEQASAVALGGFLSLIRAPEAKMMLLTPVILIVVFGSVLVTNAGKLPTQMPPLAAYGGMATVLLSMIQFVGNQFGFDRGGFRVFVLSAAPRRAILLGKNLAAAPIALTLELLILVVVEVLYHKNMRVEHFLAALPQLVTMYFLFCMLANWVSIFAPMQIRGGTMKPANPKMVPLALQVVFVMLFPVVLSPALLPLGIEAALEALVDTRGFPVCLVLALLECVLVVYLYQFVLTWQGGVLQAREVRILGVVTTKTE
jgi:ABC-2 type transport system permease protein